ncbi:MAG TPA: cupredoxin domain-containing protein [Desertimonas sp.]|nr:cupredoxin domain-containing protein [Desertimonas sp.]
MQRVAITRLVVIIAGGALMAIGVTACADDSNAGRAAATVTTGGEPAPEQQVIEIANFQFSPADVVVDAGTEVVWRNADTDIHSIISTGGLFANSDTFANGESYSVVFSEPGRYDYSCGVHPFMVGTITVQ